VLGDCDRLLTGSVSRQGVSSDRECLPTGSVFRQGVSSDRECLPTGSVSRQGVSPDRAGFIGKCRDRRRQITSKLLAIYEFVLLVSENIASNAVQRSFAMASVWVHPGERSVVSDGGPAGPSLSV